MSYQRGSLRTMHRKGGDIWMLRYRITKPNGRRMEKIEQVGLVRDFPKERDARRESDRLGMLVRINGAAADTRIHFAALAEHYLKNDFGPCALRPKTERTVLNTEHIVRAYLIPRWGKEIADDIKPLDIQHWLKFLNMENGLAWTTISKFRGTMLRIYRVGALHELVTKNPVQPVETRSVTAYRAILISPQQTLAIIGILRAPLHRILVLTCAATALRASELLALRWSDILWDQSKIAVSKRWSRGMDGPTKTPKSEGYVPLHPALAFQLLQWRDLTAFGRDTDFVFPSLKADGKVPISPAVFVADHLRPAAIAGGVHIPEGYRFGFHNMRHSLSSWLINKAKVGPKTVQSILRHSRIQTTLDLYTQADGDETRAAQGAFLEEMGMASAVCGTDCGTKIAGELLACATKEMVGATGFEPVTSTV
jgi:integrase